MKQKYLHERYIAILTWALFPACQIKTSPIKRSRDKKKKKGKPRATRNCKGKSIEERPKKVDNRETLGHWEMGRVVSKKGGSLMRVLSITERMTRWQINAKIKTGETKSVIEVLDKLEKKLRGTTE